MFLCHKEGTLHFTHTTISVPHNNAYISPFYQTAKNNGTLVALWHSGLHNKLANHSKPGKPLILKPYILIPICSPMLMSQAVVHKNKCVLVHTTFCSHHHHHYHHDMSQINVSLPIY